LIFVAARGLSFLPGSFVRFKIPGSDMLARNNAGRGTAGRAVSGAPKKLARTLILNSRHFGSQLCKSGMPFPEKHFIVSLELTKIPPAAQGGRERIDTIAGRVRNAHPRQQIVIYAHSGTWCVQPWPDRAFIPSEQTLHGARKLTWDLSMLHCCSILSTSPANLRCSAHARWSRSSRKDCKRHRNAAIRPNRIP
jgi:hypothetical protein